MIESEKLSHSNQWRTFCERTAWLEKNRGQTFSLVLDQCTLLIQDKMKHETVWNYVSISYDLLSLFRLIERVILAQIEYQYPFATVYNQEISFYLFHQNTMSNSQWYERFSTKVGV